MRRLLSIAVAALAAVSVIFARGGMQAPEAEQPAEKKLIDLKSDNMGPVAPGDSVIFLVGNFAAQHNGAVITLLAVCGLTHKESYIDIFVTSLLITVATGFIMIAFHAVTGLV